MPQESSESQVTRRPPDSSDDAIDKLLRYEQALLEGARSPLSAGIDAQTARTVRLLADTLGPGSSEAPETRPQNCATDWELPNPFGRFTIVRRIGIGAFGSVWKAEDPNTKRFVALKILHPELRCIPNLSQRFLNEAYAAARLNHPHIVRVHEAGMIDGISYIATEYVSGDKLATSRDGQPVYSPRDAAAIAMQLASAVHHSHQQGVLHRDIKPDNILIDVPVAADRETPAAVVPRLTDFGLARLQDQREELSSIGMLVGTLDYMAPEQLVGDPSQVGPAVDIYSLGLVLFELLTGRHPRRCGGNVLRAIESSGQTPSPKSIRSDVPADLDAICMRCLRKLPEERFASADALCRDLGNFLEGRPTETRPLNIVEKLGRWAWANQSVAVVIGLAAIFLLALQLLTFYHGRTLKVKNAELELAHHTSQTQQKVVERHERLYRDLAWTSGIKNAFTSFEKGELQAAMREVKHLRETHADAAKRPEWKLLEAELKACLRPLYDTKFPIWEIVRIPNTNLIAFGGDHSDLFVFDLAQRQVVKKIDTRLAAVSALAARHDGRYLAVGGPTNPDDDLSRPMLIDLETFVIERLDVAGPTTIESLAFSADDQYLAVGFRYEDAKVIDLKSNGLVTVPASRRAMSIGWSSASQLWVHSDHGKLTRIQMDSEQQEVTTIPDGLESFHVFPESSVSLVARGHVAGCWLVSTESATVLAELQGGERRAKCVALSEDQMWAAQGGSTGEVTVWSLEQADDHSGAPVIEPLVVHRVVDGGVAALAWLGKELLVAGESGQLAIWSPQAESCQFGDQEVTAVVFADAHNALLGLENGAIAEYPIVHLPFVGDGRPQVIDPNRSQLLAALTGVAVSSFAIDERTGTVVAGFVDGSLAILTKCRDGSGYHLQRVASERAGSLPTDETKTRADAVVALNDQRLFWSFSGGDLQTLSIAEPRKSIRGETSNEVTGMETLPGLLQLVTCGEFEGIRIHDQLTLQELARVGHNHVGVIDFCENNGWMVLGHADGVLSFLEPRTREQLFKLQPHAAKVRAYAQNASGSLALSIDEEAIAVVSSPTNQTVFGRLFAPRIHVDRPTHMRSTCGISPCGRYAMIQTHLWRPSGRDDVMLRFYAL